MEDENAKFKRPLADTMPDNVVPKDFPGKNRRRRSRDERRRFRRCGIVISRSAAPAVLSVSIPGLVGRARPPDDPEIRKEMRKIAGDRRGVGYRRIGVTPEREGYVMNHKKPCRLYTEEQPGVGRRRGRK